jgi:poly-gamma-glutamate synthase PgsB/CapB
MGNTFEAQLKSICSAIPKNSKIITGESTYIETIRSYTKAQNSKFIKAIELNETEKSLIPKKAHEINVQLALTTCIESGIARETAFNGILKQIEKAESPLYKIPQTTKTQYFLNAFTVNDIDSVDEYLDHWITELNIKEKITVVFNTRSDRPLRTGLFIDWINSYHENIEKVILTGDHKMRAHRLLKASKYHIDTTKIQGNSSIQIKKTILENAKNSQLIIGVGNVKGLGYQIINEFSKAS